MSEPAKRAKYAAKDLATKVKILKALKDGASREETKAIAHRSPPTTGGSAVAVDRYCTRVEAAVEWTTYMRASREIPTKTCAMNYVQCVVPRKKPQTLSSF
ncbi:hypothetical protein HPB52_019102 [Rhipicephalus sanguineus]|uniref:Uncharacterized protein n=1 Tax=Rhipicephalus sanguineus TaxID=34632 RepID=A0A9D4QFS1_RHISA|nr:hypothetical protein HPB52_019102 [Rhipicephalus sanguineus]